jgi:hypothetical protein
MKSSSWIVCALALGCGAAPGGVDAGAVDTGTGVDTGTALDTGTEDTGAGPAATGTVPLEACRGLDGVDENCALVFDASACTAAPCARLVVAFSGGEQGCTGTGYTNVLAAYASHGYAAVCINYFETATGSGTVPYLDEADRIDLAMREATTGAWARAYWTGEDLLIEGISHGSTAPPILMARTALDDEAHWHGTGTTGACFFDGSYDQAATAENLRTSGALGGECRFPVAYARWLERYCGAGATSCDLTMEPAALEDTITTVDPAAYAIHDFQLLECGSGLDACREDILPAPPIEALCGTIDASPDHTCAFVSIPDQSHIECHAMSFDRCRTWFEAL